MLTPREAEVLTLRAEGLSNKQIASRLGIDPSTVGNYSQHLRRKLHAKNTAHAIAQAYRCGLLTVEREGETDMTQLDWIGARRCESSGCGQVARVEGGVRLRSSKRPDETITLDTAEWLAFVDAIANGDFAELTAVTP